MEKKPQTREQRSFERLQRAINKASPKESRVLQSLFGHWLTPPNNQDWVVDAQWERIQQEPASARSLLYLILAATLLLLLWSAFAELDEVARGEGKVIPSQKLQVIQSYDGGMVDEIRVHEGQIVNSGDILVKLDPTRFQANLRESHAKFQILSAQVARLRALAQKKPLIFEPEFEKDAPQIVAHEQELYVSNKRELEKQINIQKKQQEQRQHDLKEAFAAREQYTENLVLIDRELEVTRPLLRSGAVSDIDIIRLERQAVDIRGELKRTQAVINRNLAAIEEAANKISEVELSMLNRWNSELSDSILKLEALRQSEAGLADRVAQTEVRSPVKGTVQRLLVNTVGGILQPGSDILEIIPLDDQLIIEAKILPKDIAFLHPGQPAMVKFTAYDFAIYGGMTAKVVLISADTITDEKDNTYYLVRLKTDQNQFSQDLSIIPGMITQVDIITGKKTVLEYLLKPILRATSQAMTER